MQHGKEALFSTADPLPWLAMPYLQIAGLLWGTFWSGRQWVSVDWCIGKVVEIGGD